MSTMKKTMIASVLAALLLGVPVAQGQDIPLVAPTLPAQGEVDFCDNLDNAIPEMLSTLLVNFIDEDDLAQFEPILNDLNCDAADINGEIVEDMPTGNGMLDSFELGLLAHVMNTTGYSQNGMDSDTAYAAFSQNFNVASDALFLGLTESDLVAGYASLISLLPGAWDALQQLIDNLVPVLAGYATLGDDTSFGSILTIVGLLEELGVTPPTADDFNRLNDGAFFGPNGNLDGDVASNFLEYVEFSAGGTDINAYIAAASDPAIAPEITVIFDGFRLIKTGPPLVEEGDSIGLAYPVELAYEGEATFQWQKDFVDIPGEIGMSLQLSNVMDADEGVYTLVVTDESKGVYTSAGYTLDVLPEGSVPVAGGFGLALLTGACALTGLAGIRRKK
jgi:hypothetical protein